ncbi:MAG: hypothetical protein HON90_14615 [Halobacteriovoraceae bacterium]|jgi:hypothetical protein|nr:hypothetical protein [Halobacteriovoraceae bacterium]
MKAHFLFKSIYVVTILGLISCTDNNNSSRNHVQISKEKVESVHVSAKNNCESKNLEEKYFEHDRISNQLIKLAQKKCEFNKLSKIILNSKENKKYLYYEKFIKPCTVSQCSFLSVVKNTKDYTAIAYRAYKTLDMSLLEKISIIKLLYNTNISGDRDVRKKLDVNYLKLYLKFYKNNKNLSQYQSDTNLFDIVLKRYLSDNLSLMDQIHLYKLFNIRDYLTRFNEVGYAPIVSQSLLEHSFFDAEFMQNELDEIIHDFSNETETQLRQLSIPAKHLYIINLKLRHNTLVASSLIKTLFKTFNLSSEFFNSLNKYYDALFAKTNIAVAKKLKAFLLNNSSTSTNVQIRKIVNGELKDIGSMWGEYREKYRQSEMFYSLLSPEQKKKIKFNSTVADYKISVFSESLHQLLLMIYFSEDTSARVFLPFRPAQTISQAINTIFFDQGILNWLDYTGSFKKKIDAYELMLMLQNSNIDNIINAFGYSRSFFWKKFFDLFLLKEINARTNTMKHWVSLLNGNYFFTENFKLCETKHKMPVNLANIKNEISLFKDDKIRKMFLSYSERFEDDKDLYDNKSSARFLLTHQESVEFFEKLRIEGSWKITASENLLGKLRLNFGDSLLNKISAYQDFITNEFITTFRKYSRCHFSLATRNKELRNEVFTALFTFFKKLYYGEESSYTSISKSIPKNLVLTSSYIKFTPSDLLGIIKTHLDKNSQYFNLFLENESTYLNEYNTNEEVLFYQHLDQNVSFDQFIYQVFTDIFNSDNELFLFKSFERSFLANYGEFLSLNTSFIKFDIQQGKDIDSALDELIADHSTAMRIGKYPEFFKNSIPVPDSLFALDSEGYYSNLGVEFDYIKDTTVKLRAYFDILIGENLIDSSGIDRSYKLYSRYKLPTEPIDPRQSIENRVSIFDEFKILNLSKVNTSQQLGLSVVQEYYQIQESLLLNRLSKKIEYTQKLKQRINAYTGDLTMSLGHSNKKHYKLKLYSPGLFDLFDSYVLDIQDVISKH